MNDQTVLHLTRDLMLVARVSALARDHGASYRSIASAAALLERLESGNERIDGPEKLIVLVDLQLPGLDIAGTLAEIQKLAPHASVTAYAQHVHTELLDQARTSPVAKVLTRGQFDRNLSGIFGKSTAE